MTPLESFTAMKRLPKPLLYKAPPLADWKANRDLMEQFSRVCDTVTVNVGPHRIDAVLDQIWMANEWAKVYGLDRVLWIGSDSSEPATDDANYAQQVEDLPWLAQRFKPDYIVLDWESAPRRGWRDCNYPACAASWARMYLLIQESFPNLRDNQIVVFNKLARKWQPPRGFQPVACVTDQACGGALPSVSLYDRDILANLATWDASRRNAWACDYNIMVPVFQWFGEQPTTPQGANKFGPLFTRQRFSDTNPPHISAVRDLGWRWAHNPDWSMAKLGCVWGVRPESEAWCERAVAFCEAALLPQEGGV